MNHLPGLTFWALSLASEDLIASWELDLYVADFAYGPADERLDEARSVVDRLTLDGRLEVYLDPRDGSPPTQLSQERLLAALSEPIRTQEASSDKPALYFTTSDLGDEAYFNSPTQDG